MRYRADRTPMWIIGLAVAFMALAAGGVLAARKAWSQDWVLIWPR